MKKILNIILVLVLITASLLSITACGGEMNSYNEAGLKFKLPKEMKKANVNYADLAFANNDGCEFFIYFYSSSELLTELYISKDSTVLEYADWFVGVNDYEGVERKYNEGENVIIQYYVYEPDGENTFFYDYVVRNETNLYHVTMACRGDDKDKYKPIFDEWSEYIELTALTA